MKLPLRYFLIACLLLGAIGVPLGWRVYQARQLRLAAEKAAEIESLEKELAEVSANVPPNVDLDIPFDVGPLPTVRADKRQPAGAM